MSLLNSRSFSTPLSLVLVWTLSIAFLGRLQAQQPKPPQPQTDSYNLTGEWKLFDDKNTDSNFRIEQKGSRITIRFKRGTQDDSSPPHWGSPKESVYAGEINGNEFILPCVSGCDRLVTEYTGEKNLEIALQGRFVKSSLPSAPSSQPPNTFPVVVEGDRIYIRFIICGYYRDDTFFRECKEKSLSKHLAEQPFEEYAYNFLYKDSTLVQPTALAEDADKKEERDPLEIRILPKISADDVTPIGSEASQIRDVIVVDHSPFGRPAENAFPGTEKPSDMKNSRTLFLYGRNLRKDLKSPVDVESLNDRKISYTVLDPEQLTGREKSAVRAEFAPEYESNNPGSETTLKVVEERVKKRLASALKNGPMTPKERKDFLKAVKEKEEAFLKKEDEAFLKVVKERLASALEIGRTKAQKYMTSEEKDAFKKMDQMLVLASFRGTGLPDFKEFQFNGAVGRWFLIYGSTKAEVNIVRSTNPGAPQGLERTEPTDIIFLPERMMLEVETEREFDPDVAELIRRRPLSLGENKIRLTLLRNGELVQSGGRPLVLEAERVPGQKKLYRTVPFDVLPEGAPGESPVRAKHGDRLAPQLAEDQDRWLVFNPKLARAFVPDLQGTLWQRALRKADEDFPVTGPGSRVPSGTLVSHPLRERLAKTRQNPSAGEITTDVVYEKYPLEKRRDGRLYAKADIRLGHVAAMSLLKNEFISMMEAYQQELSKIDVKDDDAAAASHDLIAPTICNDSRISPRFPLTNFPVKSGRLKPITGEPEKLPFHFYVICPDQGLLKNRNDPRLRPKAFPSYRAYIAKDTAFTLEKFKEAVNTYKKAVADATQSAAETSKLLPLLQLTGVNFRPMVERLRPRLMKFDIDKKRWVPDPVAREFVGRVESLADEFEAQKKVDEAKAQLFLLALSLVPFAAPGSLLLRITVNALFAGDVAANVIPTYIQQNEEAKFALGAQGILGPERLRIAEAQQTPGWAVILAVGGAALGITVDLREVLVVTGAAERAVEALAKIKGKGLESFRRLSKEEQAAVLREGADASAKAAKGEALTETQRAAQEKVGKLAEEIESARTAARAESSGTAATVGGPVRPRPPAAPPEEVRKIVTQVETELASANEKLKAIEGSVDKVAIKVAKDKVGELKLRKEILDEALKIDAPELARLSADDLEFLNTLALTDGRRTAAQKLLLENYKNWGDLKHAFNGKPPAVSKVDMLKVVKYRNEAVDDLLGKVLKEVDPSGAALERKAFGSTSLTSDYDISIKGDGAERAVIKFNEKFRSDPRFKNLESGTVFDTNVYTDPVYNLFKGKTAAGRSLQLDPLQFDELRQFMYDQMATRKYLTDDEWARHVARMIDGAPAEMKDVVKYALSEAQQGNASARSLINKKLAPLGKNTENADANSLLRATNDAYGDILSDIDKLRTESRRLEKLGRDLKLEDFVTDPRVIELTGGRDYLTVLKKIEGLIGTSRPEAKSVIDTLKAQLQELIARQARSKQGIALYFASEAYQTEGAIAHVVGELQEAGRQIKLEQLLSNARGKEIIREGNLTPGQYLNSFYENRANMFKELEHAKNLAGAFGDPRYAAAKAAKYFVRQLDAVNQSGIRLQGVKAEDVVELTVKIAKDKDKLEAVAGLLKGKNLTGDEFVKAVEEASNQMSVMALGNSPVKPKATEISNYLRDTDPEFAKLAGGPGGVRPSGERPRPSRRPAADPERTAADPDTSTRPDDRPTAPDSDKPASGDKPPQPKTSAAEPDAPKIGEIVSAANGQKFFVGRNGQKLLLGEQIGQGRYATVYELKDGTNRVVKVYRQPANSGTKIQTVIEDIKNGSAILEKYDIPQPKTFWEESVLEGDLPFIIQERVEPAGQFANNVTDDMGRAIARLYAKLGRGNVAWEDGHIGNIFFKQEGNELIAGVLDVDNIAEWNKMSDRVADRITLYEYAPGRVDEGKAPIQSLGKAKYPPGRVTNKATGHVYPDAKFFMEKMLEAKGYIRYDPETKTFVKGLIDPKIIRENGFPDLDRHVDFDFTKLPESPPEEGRLIPFPFSPVRPMQAPFAIARSMIARQALAA
jgi:hypothetical protein